MITLLAPAQFGRNIGAQVNANSKYGSKSTHGTIYGFFNSSQLNARNFFDTANGNATAPLLSGTEPFLFTGIASGNQRVLLNGLPLSVRNESGVKDSLTLALGKGNDDATKTEHGFVSLVNDRGQVRAFWLDGRDRTTGGQALRTAAVAAQPSASERLDERVCDCCHTSAAQTEDGPIVVYRDRSKNEVRDISIVRRAEKGWTAPRPVASDGWRIAGCPVNGPAVAARGKTVAVAWFTAARDEPKVEVAFSGDSGATFDRPIVVDSAGPLGRVGVELDGDEAIVLWAATEGKAPSIRLRRVSPSGKLGPPSVVAPTSVARTSGFPHIRRAGLDLAIAWLEPSSPARSRRSPARSNGQVAESARGGRGPRPSPTTESSRKR